jgi:hypothetical protein
MAFSPFATLDYPGPIAKREEASMTEKDPNRRAFLQSGAHLCAGMAAGALIAGAGTAAAEEGTAPSAGAAQRYLLIGLVGSENPTRANFPFAWAAALKEAGNEVRLELAGDATVLMRTAVANSVHPVGWPPFSEALAKVVQHKIPIFV